MIIKRKSNESLIRLIKESHVWAIVCICLSLFLTMVFQFFYWTLAAFYAILFMLSAILWVVLKVGTTIQFEVREK